MAAREMPDGLTLTEEVITEEDAQRVIEYFTTDLEWNGAYKRRTHGFYYNYDYKRGAATPNGSEPPAWMENLFEEIIEDYMPDIEPEEPLLILVNEYTKGQQITAHTDHTSIFGPVIGSLSLGAECLMRMSRDNLKVSVPMPARSLLVLEGPARYLWKHGLRNSKKATRWSVTFRTIVE
jgi:alkylated DNA repair dioxygenase AlkB